MVSCAVSTCKRRSEKSNYTKDGISYHTFPKHPVLRKAWLDFCRRPLTWVPRRTSCICSDHFEPSCFQVGSRRKINDDAVPTLFSCDCKKYCTTHGTVSSAAHDTESSADSPPLYERAPIDDSETQVTEMPITVKIEMEEDFSEHEEDIMEKLEDKKRKQENDPIAIDAKKVRVELVPVAQSQCKQTQYQVIVQPQQPQVQSQSQYVGVLQHAQQHKASHATQSQAQKQPEASEPVVVPEFFMNVVVQNQNEILSILKSQVLLQDPDPELLTFLRFLGSKLLRYPKKKRDELQDRISEMLLLE